MPRRSYTKPQRKAFAEQLRTKTAEQVARAAKRSPATVRAWAREFGIPVRNSTQRNGGKASRLTPEQTAQRRKELKREQQKQAQRRKRVRDQMAADPNYFESAAKRRISRKSPQEKMHLEKTSAGRPTVRAQKAQASFEKALAYHEKVTGVRVNARKHPVLYRMLRHEAGWTRKSLPDMEHRDYNRALSRFMSDEEQVIARAVYKASWGDVLQLVDDVGHALLPSGH